jgi:hypothetical protein
MATLRTVINRVLRTVGEDEVASSVSTLTDTYHILVVEFINQFKEKIEDAHQWRSLRQVLTASVVGPAVSGVIASANERTRLIYELNPENGQAVPVVFDITDTSNPIPLTEMDLAELLFRVEQDAGNTATSPSYFAIDSSEGDVVTLRVWPVPAATRNFRLSMIVPQDYLDVDDLDTNIKIPQSPLLQGAIWFALQERGEELGQASMFSEEAYRQSLDDAVSRDANAQGDYQLVPV